MLSKKECFGDERHLCAGRLQCAGLVQKLVREQWIGAVVHLAADSLVGESMTRQDKYFQNNLINGINFLTALIEAGVRWFILSSTAAVYGGPKYSPIDEAHPTQPVNVYSGTKLMLEQVLSWYEWAYNLRYFPPVLIREGSGGTSGRFEPDSTNLGWRTRYGELDDMVCTAWNWHWSHPQRDGK